MSERREHFAPFLGSWILDAESCQYDQGQPPTEGYYQIDEQNERLVFTMRWKDEMGQEHAMTISGAPDGSKESFPGGDLADALSVDAISPRELVSVAYYKGKQRMVAQRQLDQSLMAMRVTQVVFLPDGSHSANISVYRRVIEN